MRLLLDTHAFIWFVDNDKKLPNNAKIQIENPNNTIFISIASLWEIAIKISLEKLDVSVSIEEMVNLIYENGFEILPILPENIIMISSLDFHHRDPFDRIIITQGLHEQIKIVGKDRVFDKYGIKRIWK